MPSVDDTQTSDTPSQTIHDIDPSGDLVLIVGSDGLYNGVDGVVGVGVVASFRIHSGNLCRASSVFRTMLTGSFREARRYTDSEQWTVELPDDDPTAFGILLMIIHSHFRQSPLGHKYSSPLRCHHSDGQVRHDGYSSSLGIDLAPFNQQRTRRSPGLDLPPFNQHRTTRAGDLDCLGVGRYDSV